MRLLKWIILLAVFSITSQAYAVDFKFKDINGQHHKLSDYRGAWTIVNYWGVNCPPCRAEVPALNRIERQYRGKAKIIGIELMSSTNKDIRSFVKNNGMRFTVAGTQRSVIHPLGKMVKRLPTTFFISPQGQLVRTHQGILKEHHVRGFVNQPQTKKAKAKPPTPAKKQIAKVQVARPAPPKKVQQVKVAPKKIQKVVIVKKKKAPAKKVNTHDFLMGINADDFF